MNLSRLLFACFALALVPIGAALAAKPPPQGEHTLTLNAQPSPVVFGKTTTLSGKLAGPSPAGVELTLEEDTTVPLGDRFSPAKSKATTAADGSFSFIVEPAVNTQYRVVAKTKPATESPARLVNVRPRVKIAVSDRTPAVGSRVSFTGAVLPAHDGATARIQRRKSGTWKTVAKTTLADAGDAQSTYVKAVRVRTDGTYRVKVAKDADHIAGVSRRVKISVS